jgi:hypothetical protein
LICLRANEYLEPGAWNEVCLLDPLLDTPEETLTLREAELEMMTEQAAKFRDIAQDKDAEIERLKKEVAFQTDMACQADVACVRLKALLARAADALEGATKLVRTQSESDLIAELRKAAE